MPRLLVPAGSLTGGQLAHTIATDIRTSPAWRHPTLTAHHAMINLDVEVTEIRDAARALWCLRHDPVAPDDPEMRESATTPESSIVDPLVALHRYRNSPIPLNPLLAEADIARRRQQRRGQGHDGSVHEALC